MTTDYSLRANNLRRSERGAALATAILMLALLSCIALTVLAVVQTETRVAGSDLERTQAFYAAAAGIEKMTSDFSTLFARTSRPTTTQMNNIAALPPDLAGEGFSFNQAIAEDTATLAAMRATQGITNGAYPTVNVKDGPLVGLTASVAPYTLTTTATSAASQVNLTRTMNNYLVPIFQFGMFSNEDMEIHPGPNFTFNGRVHANGNLYLNGNVTFLDKVTTAKEVVRDVLRNGATHTGTVTFNSGPLPVGGASVVLGPNVGGNDVTSPVGTINSFWKSTSVATFGGQLLSLSTGIAPLLLPLQLDGNQTREIIKRRMPNDDITLSDSRFHSKSEIRILLDDEGVVNDASGISAAQNGDGTTNAGVNLSTFVPLPLPAGATGSSATSGGRALWRIADNGSYVNTTADAILQQTPGSSTYADTVRSAQAVSITSGSRPSPNVNRGTVPAGAGLNGHILIQIVDTSVIPAVVRDVTKEVLSMGMTEGEPNAIVMLQRPLWASYLQGTRDASGGTNTLKALTDNYFGADGEIGVSVQDPNGYLIGILNDGRTRQDTPALGSNNVIVPINLYNVREGRLNTGLAATNIYERGMTSVVELNMGNLARWLDGVYDTNLLVGTPALSANIVGPDGYIVYVSDRRGDNRNAETDSTGVVLASTSNGTCDNEDIYGPNGALDPGEDVIDFGAKKTTLQKDVTELPDPTVLGTVTVGTTNLNRTPLADIITAWSNPNNYFRRAVRLFNGETLQTTVGGANKLSTTKGITVASENMVYIWGNYNTTGIDVAPPAGQSCLNEAPAPCLYTGLQVPASIVCDAFFPLSKTWFDSEIAMYPDLVSRRAADRTSPGVTSETSLRAGIIAGNNLSALSALSSAGPDAGNWSATSDDNESRLNGGMHNFPRFLEGWGGRFNLVGSLIPLYHSTQAMGQYNANSSIYGAPQRNWAFDSTFRRPDRLPPGTPQFQYLEPTAFRQVLY